MLKYEDIVDPPREGRKLVVLGDTCNSEMIKSIAMDADVLIHEATNAWTKEYDIAKKITPLGLERETISHGHSTPQMAGRFCKSINAKRLILTHFSPRLKLYSICFKKK